MYKNKFRIDWKKAGLMGSIAGIMALTMSCSSSNANEDNQEQDATSMKAIPVNTTSVNQQELPVTLKASGNIEAWEEAYISGQNGIRIHDILVDEGDRVQKGQLLVRMNDAQVVQAREQYQLAKQDVERLDTLVEIGSVSKQKFDQAKSQLETAKSQLNSLLQNTTLRAPLTGVITDRYFVNGELYIPGTNSPAILRIMQMQPVKLNINIAEKYYSQVSKHLPVRIKPEAYSDTVFEGTVHKLHPTVDKNTRTFKVEIKIDNHHNLLRPGMFASAKLELGKTKDLFIPYSAVVKQPGSSVRYVYTIDDQNRAKRQEINTGIRYDDLVQVKSGLSENDKLVTDGMARVQDNRKVKLINN